VTADLSQIDVWLFDLDNTLYPLDAQFMSLIDSEIDDYIPVIAPIGVAEDGQTYNINADTVAGAVASAVKAERLVLLTDVEGVLDQDKKLISHLTVTQARALIANGTISGGMIPKISTAIEAVEAGVHAAVILDGRIPHVLLLELFTEHGAGTLITAG
jgi:acetylglutamate kinase